MSGLNLAYQSESASVYHGRAEDLLATMAKESVHLIVTDPPYGVEWRSNLRTERFDLIAGDGAHADDRAAVRAVLEQCVRVVGQNRHLYVFGPGEVLDGLKVSEVVPMVWDKGVMGAGDRTAAWGPAHEQINFMVSKFRHAGQSGKPGVPTRLRKGTVLSYMRQTGRKVRHPSEKPVPLMRELIESSTRQGETVADVYAGTMSTAVAAILTGRKAIVCELKREYVDLGVERIKRAESLADEMRAA